MTKAWCIIGDFNAVLHKDDRIGGNKVTDHEVNELQCLLDHCELQELYSRGSFYSWTNKRV